MGVVVRIARAPGIRRLVKKHDSPGESRESPDERDGEPLWCASCRREVLFGAASCPQCGGEALTAHQLARRSGDLPSRPDSGPTAW